MLDQFTHTLTQRWLILGVVGFRHGAFAAYGYFQSNQHPISVELSGQPEPDLSCDLGRGDVTPAVGGRRDRRSRRCPSTPPCSTTSTISLRSSAIIPTAARTMGWIWMPGAAPSSTLRSTARSRKCNAAVWRATRAAARAGAIIVWFQSAETGHYILLAHFTSLNDWVQLGATFDAGAPFGLSGSTGYSSGPHVHVQVNPDQMGNAGSTQPAWEFPWLHCTEPVLGALFGATCP